MPHYKDGTPAQVGDLVKGRGYNIKHEIIGKVVRVQRGAEHCNLEVACVAKESPVYTTSGEHAMIHVPSTIEYGEAAAFERIA